MSDAIGLILVGQFVSFMSGNTTELAIAAASGEGSRLLFLPVLLLVFVAGNAIGEIVMASSGRRQSVLLLLVSILLALPAAAPSLLPWAILPAVLAMGAMNAAIDQVGGHPFSVTFVTGALSRFGRGLGRWLAGERTTGWVLQLVPWLGMLLGAVLGAFLERFYGLNAFLGAASVAFFVALVCLIIPARWRADYTATSARRRR